MPSNPEGGGLPHVSSSSSEYLADYTSQPWDERRSAAEDVRAILEAHGLEEWARRIGRCAEFVHFVWTDGALKFFEAHFCRVRTCPVCDWRRAMTWRAKFYAVLPRVQEAYPKAKWVLLTLTVRNCSISELSQTLDQMSRGWQRFIKRAEFQPVLGWLRTAEITRGKDDSAHPHYHVLMLMPTAYFSRYYVRRERWAEVWQECMALDYRPVVDVRVVRSDGVVPEAMKYSVKPSGALEDGGWFAEMASQLRRHRLIASGGVLRQAFRELEHQRLETDQGSELTFAWRRVERRYKRRQPRGSASSEG